VYPLDLKTVVFGLREEVSRTDTAQSIARYIVACLYATSSIDVYFLASSYLIDRSTEGINIFTFGFGFKYLTDWKS
jgi:hypothetical protein